MGIRIDPELKSLIPEITAEEKERLEKSILEEGCRDPLVTWDEILLDGHNRYEICTRHKIPYQTINKTFDNRDQAKLWIISNQLGRRNISPEQKTYLIGVQYKLEKKQGKRTDLTSDQNDPKLQTAERIAEQHKVSAATVKRAKKYAEAVDKLPEEEKKEVLEGKSPKTKAEIIGQQSRIAPRIAGNNQVEYGERKPLAKSKVEMRGDAFLYQTKLRKVIGILPTKPPRDLTEAEYVVLKKLALLIVKRLRTFEVEESCVQEPMLLGEVITARHAIEFIPSELKQSPKFLPGSFELPASVKFVPQDPKPPKQAGCL